MTAPVPVGDSDLAELVPLAQVIDHTVRTTSTRLGDLTDLVAALTLAVAGYMGRQLGPDPAAVARIAAVLDRPGQLPAGLRELLEHAATNPTGGDSA
ncbi:MAG TPA: hypothetical protein VK545_00490 [Streptomyces sp.]|nr:hypothetical protein [Streptomyces sp.]